MTMPLMSIACIRRIRSTDPESRQTPIGAIHLLELLLGAELVGVAALLLTLWSVLVFHLWQGLDMRGISDSARA